MLLQTDGTHPRNMQFIQILSSKKFLNHKTIDKITRTTETQKTFKIKIGVYIQKVIQGWLYTYHISHFATVCTKYVKKYKTLTIDFSFKFCVSLMPRKNE